MFTRHGRGRIAYVEPGMLPAVWPLVGPPVPNLQLYDSATILAQLTRRDPSGRAWHLNTAYIEFENAGGAAVAVPTATPDAGRNYYDNLSLSATRDYLRVPVIHTELASSDETNYPDGDLAVFYAHTAGSVGVHGKPFSAAQQSRVYGMALVAAPVDADPSQDRVYARLYYTNSAQQFIKTATTQIGLEYELPFTL